MRVCLYVYALAYSSISTVSQVNVIFAFKIKLCSFKQLVVSRTNQILLLFGEKKIYLQVGDSLFTLLIIHIY